VSGARERPWLERGIAAGLVACAAWDLRGFLGPGLPIFFDFASHVTRTWFVEQALDQGAFPGWSHWWYGGYRLLEFYSPLYYWLSGALARALGGDPILATKLTLWIGLVALVLATHLFLRRLVASPWLAAAGAIWLLKGPLVRWIFGTVGNLPSLIPLLALPLWLAQLQGLARVGGRPAALFAGTALAVAAMLAGHLTNALLLLPGALAFAAVSLGQRPGAPAGLAAPTLALGLGGAAAGLLTAFVWLPAWLDLELASLALVRESPTGLRLDLHPVMVAAGRWSFSWEYSKVRDHGYWIFHGAVLLALLSLLPGLRRWRPAALALGATLLVSPLAEGRALLALPFYLAALWVQALCDLGARLGRAAHPGAAAGLGILTLIGVVWWPGLERDNPVPRYEPADALDVYRRLPRGGAGRTFDLSFEHGRIDAFYGAGALSPYLSGRAIPFGGFPQGAPLDTNVTMALASPWTEARRDGPDAWPEALLDVLALLHVEYLVERGDGGIFRLEHATPVLFAPRIEALPAALRQGAPGGANPLIHHLVRSWRESRADMGEFLRHAAFSPVTFTRSGRDWGLLGLVEQMGIDRRRATARRFFAARPEDAAGAPGPGGAAAFAVLEQREDPGRIEIRARSSAPGFVRVAYSWDPALRVTLDGDPVRPRPDALGGGFLLPFPSGTHAIEIRPPAFALRKALALAALPPAVLLVALAASGRGRARP